MLTYKRLQRPSQVLQLWPFFLTGLKSVALRSGEVLDETVLQKTICHDAADHEHNFVCVGYVHGRPSAFGVFEECTPRFVTTRSFVTRVFYHQSGERGLSVGLVQFFETWAKQQGVKWHIISTRRKSGSAIKLFTGPKYNFKQSSLVFEKEL